MKKSVNIILFLFVFIFPLLVSASASSGVIDTVNKYAWSENAGWINFGTTNSTVNITDTELTGYIWNENYGWINLAPTNGGVKNDGEGDLSGNAWGERLGWIDFSGVSINASGKFVGSATNDILGHINFDCTNCEVTTDYRPTSQRPTASINTSGSRHDIIFITPTGTSTPTEEVGPTPIKKITFIEKLIPAQKFISYVGNIVAMGASNFFNQIPNRLIALVPDFLKGGLLKSGIAQIPIEQAVPPKAQLAFRGEWNLFSQEALKEFVLAPLPRSIASLAEKFPELGQTLKKVGITKVTDVKKLNSVKLNLPGLSESVGLPKTTIAYGKFSLPAGVPLSKLTSDVKNKMPTEIVFAKTGGELIDFNIALTIGKKGEAEQKIKTIVGRPIKLVVKPDQPVKAIKGYVVFKSKKPRPSAFSPVLNQMAASALFSEPEFSQVQEKPIDPTEELVLLEFEYTDPDGDGIYTADIQAPVVDGEYEIITVMNYENPRLAMREMRLVTVVDPEGYIYESNSGKETRIPGAVATIFWLNPETSKYEIWPANEYQQENPQTTDVRGTYSFLVPEGFYSLTVEAPGYTTYEGKAFQVSEGSGIHTNIEMKTKYWWLNMVDWKTILLVVVILLLVYNFYKDRVRDKLLKK